MCAVQPSRSQGRSCRLGRLIGDFVLPRPGARFVMNLVELRDLEAENSTIRASAAIHRFDFERERDRADSFKAEAYVLFCYWLEDMRIVQDQKT